MQEHSLTTKDLSLYYRVMGTGAPVILIHGFAEDGDIWKNLIPALEKEYRLIIPDLRGSGKSTGDTEGISMESMAEDIHLIVEKEGIEECTMIGHSMGGYITLAYVDKYPEKLNKFGLFHSTAYPDSEEKQEVRKKNIDFIRKHGSSRFVEQTTPNLFSEETRNNNQGIVKEFVDRYCNFSPASLVYYTEAMKNRKDRIEVLKKFNKPVLFIFGEFDNAVPIEQGLKQCIIPEFSYIYIAAHSGHMGMLEEPEFSIKALQDFLTGS